MSATTRRSARTLVVLTAVPLVLMSGGAAALADPDPGPSVEEPSAAATSPRYEVLPPWLVFPGWRGYMLPPAERGHVLEFLDH